MPLLLDLAVLVAILAAAAGAGTLATGPRLPLALRSALGLALLAHALFFLGLVGWLRPAPIIALYVIAIAGALRGWQMADGRWRSAERGGRSAEGVRGPIPPLPSALRPPPSALRAPPSAIRHLPSCAILIGLFLLALHPPLAWDETLYHLPAVRSIAESGRLQFLSDNRFPVFPRLHELLCVPPFLLAGDVATHLVSLAELIILAALVYEWGGALATALLLGSPIVLHFGTVLHVDTALALFVAAGFYCLDREEDAIAGFFLGTACSVKYLGGFFAVAALVIRRRLKYAMWCLAAALPTTIWIFAYTHDPLFPFVRDSLWRLLSPPVAFGTRVVRTLTLPWNVTFARQHVNFQPPVTPLFIGMLIALIAAALRDARARIVAIVCATYVIVFAFLPQDTRYLLPLLPLICVAIVRWNGWQMADGRWRKTERGRRKTERGGRKTERGGRSAEGVALTMRPQPSALRARLSAIRPQPSALRARLSAIRRLPSAIRFIAIAPGVLYVAYRLSVMGLPPMNDAQREAELRARVPEYAAVVRAGNDRVYACGGEQLEAYARGSLIGDESGPFAYRRILASDTATLAPRLRAIGVQSFLVAKRACKPPLPNGGMELVYEDESAQLWRVIASTKPRAPDSSGTSQPPP
jgi:hypothetical protein